MDNFDAEIQRGKYRHKYHIMPPAGWLNDPNGCCYFKGMYHIFFQYAPGDPEGKVRYWGHVTSKDLIKFQYEGIAIKSDTEWDKSGAYSGCSFVDDGLMEIFYTGNVKQDGNYDYINEGRISNTLTMKSEDGFSLGKKNRLLTNEDYPRDYTQHIRDPKVWKKDDKYYMVIGGRKKNDQGAILRYVSVDKEKWVFQNEITTKSSFGYMWECPDAFEIDGKSFFVCCPQGLKREEYRYQNQYQAGYFCIGDKAIETFDDVLHGADFRELDYGFDFYAPQTFVDAKGRRILIAWAGMPDAEYQNIPSVEEGWQHSLTMPRVLTVVDDKLYQYPMEEWNILRGKEQDIKTQQRIVAEVFDMEVKIANDDSIKMISFQNELQFKIEKNIVSLELLNNVGCGRKIRKTKLDQINHIRIIKDVSLLEIYINHGEAVMTTRYFSRNPEETYLSFENITEGKIYQITQ